MAEGSAWMQFMATCSATLVFFICGTFMGWPSPTLVRLQEGNTDPQVTPDQGSWIVSFMPIGSILTPIPTGYLVDIIGRKPTLAATFVPFLLSWVLVVVAESAEVLYAARLSAGLGLGMAFTVGPMYMGEIAEDRIRGTLGTLFQLMVNIGIMYEYCVGPYVSTTLLGILSAIFPVIFIATFIWMPESPYYFLVKNRRQDAEKSLLRLRCMDNPENVQKELDSMQMFVEQKRMDKGGFKDLIFNRGNRKGMIIVIGLIFFQNFSGINAILANATMIFKESKTSLDADVAVIIMGAVQVALSVVSSALVDSAGRRPLLLISCVGCAVALATEGVFFYLKTLPEVDVTSLDWLPITAMVLYLVVYTLGVGPLPMALLGELFPTSVKGVASSVSSIWLAITTLVVTKLYQVVADALGVHVVFWAFAICCVSAAVFVALIVPETKGKTLMEINQDLSFSKRTAGVTQSAHKPAPPGDHHI